MSLFDFEQEVHITKRKLFAVICIDQIQESGHESPVNKMIEHINRQLKDELQKYEDISLAYVYENGGMTEATPFCKFTETSVCRYLNIPIDGAQHNLNHLYFLSMGMLEQVQKQNDTADCRLYLLTNERFPRVNQIVWQSEGRVKINPRFIDVPIQIHLYKTPGSAGDMLEEYIRNIPGNRVIEFDNEKKH